jgi:N-acetylneuraminic acid mutarotase
MKTKRASCTINLRRELRWLASLVLFGAICSSAHAGPRTSASYNVIADTVDSGGLRSTGATYSNDASVGNVAGQSASGASATTVDSGYVAQLCDGPQITTQPSSQTATAGGSMSFTVAASGNPAPTYQWQVSTDGGSTWTNLTDTAPYSGTGTGTLTITGAATSMNGYEYQCLLSNSVQSNVPSNAVTLTVTWGVFGATGSMGTARFVHTATLLPNGKVLIAGGYFIEMSSSAGAELFDSATGTFSGTGSMTVPRAIHTATLLPDRTVLIAGGYNGNASASAELYDPATGIFRGTGSMGAGRYACAATLLPNGKVLIAGGNAGPGGNWNAMASAELYDPATGTFSATGSMGTGREYPTATLLPNGEVLIVGGSGDTSAELYDPATGTFSPTGSMGAARSYPTATLLPNGKVLIAGGTESSWTPMASAELYDPDIGTFAAAGNMGEARYAHTATLLPNGKVLIAGGSGDSFTPIASAELYDPATGIFSITASMETPRYQQTATLLPNGTVLLAGGGNHGTATSSAELYDPQDPGVPAIPVITSPANVWGNQAGCTANVPDQAGVTFAWTISGGSITAGAGSSQIAFTAGTGETVFLTCTATDPVSDASRVSMAWVDVVQGITYQLGAWNSTASFTTPRSAHTSVAYNGYVYVLGGEGSDGTRYNDVQYAPIHADGSLGSWKNATPFNTGRRSHTSIAYNGYLYVIGGTPSGGGVCNDVQYARINPDGSLGNWQGTTPFNTGRLCHTSAVDNGYLYVIQGFYYSAAWPMTDVQFAKINADGSLGAWQNTTTFSPARWGHESVAYDGRIYSMGGSNWNGSYYTLNDVRYSSANPDGTLGGWEDTTLMDLSLCSFGLVEYNRNFIITGGNNGSVGDVDNVQFVKINADGSLGSWQSMLSLDSARAGHTSVVYNGYLYVIGGSDSSGNVFNDVQYARVDLRCSSPMTPVITVPAVVAEDQPGYVAWVPPQDGSSYAWTVTGASVTGGGGTSCITFTPGDGGTVNLSCVVTNRAGMASAPGTASATITPAVTTQPVSQTVTSGAGASFTATASGDPAPAYQWQVSTDGGVTWTNLIDTAPYSGTATGTLTIAGAALSMNGYRYRCTATNGFGATSATDNATLGITLRPVVTVDLTDVFVMSAKGDGTANELLRVDKNGNQLWQTTVPVNAFGPGGDTGDRNLKEDSLYLVNIDLNGNAGGYGILKFDRYGNLEWQREVSAQYTRISANPVDGGIYVANGDGVTKIDASGTTVWGPINWGYTDFRYISTDVRTGGFFVSTSSDGGQVIKTDAAGNIVWQKSLADPQNLRANPLDGGVYVYSAYSERTVSRFDTDGNIVWSETGYPSYYNFGISVSPVDGSLTVGSGWPFLMVNFAMDGHVVYTNSNYGEFQIAPDIETGGFYGSSESGACYTGLNVRRFGADGQVVWEKPLGHAEWNRYMVVLTGVRSKFGITSFSGTPATVQLGQSATLDFAFPGGAGVITPGVGAVTSGKPVTVSPTTTTTYTLTVTNAAGTSVSAQTTVTVVAPPAITTQPTSQTVTAGGNTSFTVTCSGNPAPTQQWQVSTDGGSTWTNLTNTAPYSGTTTGTLTITGAALSMDGYQYRCNATNGVGTDATSNVVTLTVHAAPSFAATGSLGTARTAATATLLPDGEVLIAGGSNSSGMLSGAELYDPAMGTFAATGSMGTERYFHTATLLPNGKILIAGGADNSGLPVSSAELYDPATGTFTATGSMGTTRFDHTATLLTGGKVLIAGGVCGSYASTASAELYDPATGTFTPTGSMGTIRAQQTATLLPSGKVLIAGGGNWSNGILASAEIYDPATGTFTPTGNMGTVRYTHTATLLPDGKVLVAGGGGQASSYTALASAELYDPTTGSFTATGGMGTGRIFITLTAALLPSGKVLIAGGCSNSGSPAFLASAELYDPAMGTFSATANMGSVRCDETTTLLPNGKVLIAGGAGDGWTALASAELYDPQDPSIPAIPIITAPVNVYTSQTGCTASVPDQAGVAFVWTVTGGNITAGSGSNQITFNAGIGEAVFLTCTATSTSTGASKVSMVWANVVAPQAPAITTQPASQTATVGDSVTFTVGASGNPAPTCQWFLNGAALTNGIQSDGSVVSGATSATLTINGAAGAESDGTYTVTLTNAVRSVTSSAAVLSLRPSGVGANTFTPVGDLPGGIFSSQVRAATEDGQIAAGNGSILGSEDRPFLWTSTAGMKELSEPVTITAGTLMLTVSDITPDGAVIAGRVRMSPTANLRTPAIWTNDGKTLTVIPEIAGYSGGRSGAVALSADGSIVYGWSTESVSGRWQAFRWTAATGTLGLGFLNSTDTQSIPAARGVSADGSVMVGTATSSSGGSTAFIYTVSSGMRSLGYLPGGTWSQALAVTPDGTTVFGSGDSTNCPGGEWFTWTESGGMVPLGKGDVDDINQVIGGITANGLVTVCSSYIRNGNGFMEVTKVLAGAGLNIDGWSQISIFGISRNGNVLFGSAIDPSGNYEGWVATFAPGFLQNLALPATIVREPPSRTAIAGSETTFSVGVSGGPGLSVRWYLNGVALADGVQTDGSTVSGSGTLALRLGNLALAQSGSSYTALVSNSQGQSTSSAAVLTVTPPAVVSALVSGDPALTAPLSLASDGTYLYVAGTNANTADTNRDPTTGQAVFRVPIQGGTATSLYRAANPQQLAILNGNLDWIDPSSGAGTTQILQAPAAGGGTEAAIYSQAANQVIASGCGLATDGTLLYATDANAGLVFRLSADGTGLTQLGGVRYNTGRQPNAIAVSQGMIYIVDSGESTGVPDVVSIPTSGSSTFTTLYGDETGLFMDPAGIAVGNGMIYVSDPWANNTIWELPISGGNPVALVSGAPFNQLAGLTFADGVLYAADTGNNTVYQILVSGPAAAPVFITQPTSQTVTAGGNTTFTVAASGNPAPTYQWQLSTNGGSTWTNLGDTAPYSGTATGTLTITGATAAMNGYEYRCVASNGVTPNASSSAVTLTVNPVPLAAQSDFNGDGQSDLLWQNLRTGERKIGLMNGASRGAEVSLGTLPAEWNIVGTGDFNGDGQTDVLWQNSTTGQFGVYLMNGTTVMSWVSLGVFPTDWKVAGVADFNADGKPDILWQNTSTGERGLYLMNGTAVTSWMSLGVVPTDWQIAGVGDFNGDRSPDILWQNTATGELGIYLMNGTTVASWASIGVMPTVWQIAGTGDYNGDGHTDILWQNTSTGERGVYLMNGTSVTGWLSLGIVSTDWSLGPNGTLKQTVANNPDDFNGDGQSDILWQNTSTGERGIYLMNGTTVTGWASLGIGPTTWQIAGTGDFNGDGKADILWQNTSTGERGIYLMNGTTVTSWNSLGIIPAAWQIVGTGDFNGDGKTDILWQNSTNGEYGLYLMDGTAATSWVSLGVAPTEWQIAGVGDFNGDGKADILWQSTSTGERGVYLMNGTAVTSWVSLGVVPTAWQIAGTGDFNGDGKTDILWQNTSTGERGINLMNGTSVTAWVSFGIVPTVWAMKN